MPKLGNIELPITTPMKATGSDMEMLDILFDLKVGFEKEMHKLSIPLVLAVKSVKYNLIVVVLYRPPDIWLDFDGQKFQVFLSPNLQWMVHYFNDRRLKASTNFEYNALTQIVDYLSRFLPKEIVVTLKK